MIQGQTTLYKIARVKALFSRGQSWLYIFKDLAQISIGLWALKEVIGSTFNIEIGLWFIYMYPAIAFGYLFGCIGVGYIDEQRGIWKEEARYGISKDINPIGREMYDKLVEVHAELVKLEGEIHDH